MPIRARAGSSLPTASSSWSTLGANMSCSCSGAVMPRRRGPISTGIGTWYSRLHTLLRCRHIEAFWGAGTSVRPTNGLPSRDVRPLTGSCLNRPINGRKKTGSKKPVFSGLCVQANVSATTRQHRLDVTVQRQAEIVRTQNHVVGGTHQTYIHIDVVTALCIGSQQNRLGIMCFYQTGQLAGQNQLTGALLDEQAVAHFDLDHRQTFAGHGAGELLGQGAAEG